MEYLMKRLSHRKGLLHIETPLGIVNITVGLVDRHGRWVESIQVIPSCYKGEKKVMRSGYANTRLIQCKGAKV
jgi:hypothetical protein